MPEGRINDIAEISLGRMMSQLESVQADLKNIAAQVSEVTLTLARMQERGKSDYRRIEELEREVKQLKTDSLKEDGAKTMLTKLPQWGGWAAAAIIFLAQWVFDHRS